VSIFNVGCRSEVDRLFQILGPATEKLLSPSRVFVLGTVRTLAWAERVSETLTCVMCQCGCLVAAARLS